jgi:predicted DNA-binding protein
MKLLKDIEAQYIVDKTGKKTAVVLDIETFENLLEEIEDIYFGTLAEAALQQEQEYISHEQVKRKIAPKGQ